jgi:hypothetical protein
MSETMKMILLVLLTIGALFVSLSIAGWRMRRACDFIIRDLKEQKAFDPASAVELPYCKSSMFRIGMRDYRPRALNALAKHDVIRVAADGRYYLREGHNLTGTGDGAAA